MTRSHTDDADAPDDRARLLVDRLASRWQGNDGRESQEESPTPSAALASLATEHPDAVAAHVPTLVEVLRAVSDNSEAGEGADGEVVDDLVRCVGVAVAADPESITADGVGAFATAVTEGLRPGTLRAAASALFAGAGERPEAFVPAMGTLGDLLDVPDPTVAAYAAGALGRLSAVAPDAVDDPDTVDSLGTCLARDNAAVQHNAVEALATLAGERPDAVAPVAPALRALLDHEDVAVQHNAAGVLGRIVTANPTAVTPAVDSLRELQGHDDPAVGRVATATLARLAQELPDAVETAGDTDRAVDDG